MPPVYDGPLWHEALGAVMFFGLLFAPVYLFEALDRRRERSLDEELGSTEGDRAERRARYGR